MASHEKDDGLEMDHALADDCLDDPSFIVSFQFMEWKRHVFCKELE